MHPFYSEQLRVIECWYLPSHNERLWLCDELEVLYSA